MKIDIWSDVACPWCYIGKRRFERALAGFDHRNDVEVEWHSYQLDPTLPAHDDRSEAEYLAASKGAPVEQIRQMFASVAEQAAGEGLQYDFDSLVVANSLRAHQLIQLAKAHDAADAVAEALFAAHFEQSEDIGDMELLVRIGVSAGLEEEAIREALSSESELPAVRADVVRAGQLGIQAVPTFVLDMKYAVAGAQSSEVFGQALDQAWRESHPGIQVLATGEAAGQVCGPDGCA